MTNTTLERSAIRRAAALLVEARRTARPLAGLPDDARPRTVGEAHAIQEESVRALGDAIAGWKVASVVAGQLLRGVILRSVVFESPAFVPAALAPMLGIEAEIAFRFDRGLPPRAHDYSHDEVAAAVTPFPAIEVVATRFADYAAAPLLDRAADFVSNGAFIRGPMVVDWRRRDLARLEVVLRIGGAEIVRRIGGHAAGDPLRPAVALVNDLRHGGGVDAGMVMTTGTFTGLNYAKPGQSAVADFIGFGTAEVAFT